MSYQLPRAVLLIDNGYLSAIIRDEYKEDRVDYLKISELICHGYTRLRTYVYDCMPYQADPPTEVQKTLFGGKTRFFKALSKQPSFEIRFGKQRPRGDTYIQKGVDVLLTVDLVKLTSKAQVQKVFLIAGDADFVPAVKAAKEEAVSVKLYHSGGYQTLQNGRRVLKYSNELWEACDERAIIDQDLIDQCKIQTT